MIRRRPRPAFGLLPAAAALVVMAITGALGAWQAGKARVKDDVETRQARARDAAEVTVPTAFVDPLSVDGARMVARGEFLPDATVYWDNRFAGKTAGIAVITPLKLAGSAKVVLVDRGIHVPGADRTRLPAFTPAPGSVEVRGRAYLAPQRTLELAETVDAGRLWQNLTPEKFARRFGMDVHGFILREGGPPAAGAGLVRAPDRPPPPREAGMTADKHRGYALQWFSLAALTAVLFVWFTFFEHVRPDTA
ncbi:MAG: SURF1 family protein [Burkholderiales bacterium]|nr:SURF1 family protein [Burkholderiales bacterium]